MIEKQIFVRKIKSSSKRFSTINEKYNFVTYRCFLLVAWTGSPHVRIWTNVQAGHTPFLQLMLSEKISTLKHKLTVSFPYITWYQKSS